MSVLVVGLSHRTAPMELLERAALGAEEARELAARLHAGDHVEESLVLATCNRLEVVVEAGTFHGALVRVGEALSEVTGLSRDDLTPHLYVHYDERAVAHLFALACGLDSMAVGESQVLGQLREALRRGQRDGRVGPTLNVLLQQALRVGKRAHAETDIDSVSRSLVEVGLHQAAGELADLGSAHALVVGAGAMSGLAVAELARAGVARLTVVNRTRARADRLALQHGAHAADWADLTQLLTAADLVVTCTGAVGHVIEADALGTARQRAEVDAPLVLIDLALPRDVQPQVVSLPGVSVWGLAELRDVLVGAPDGASVQDAVAAVEELVTAEVAGYLTERRAARLAPTLAALRSRAARVVDAEMARLDRRVPQLPDDERHEVRRTVERVVDKLLHTPTVRVKELVAGHQHSDYGQVLRELFDLGAHEVTVLPAPALELPDDLTTDLTADLRGGR